MRRDRVPRTDRRRGARRWPVLVALLTIAFAWPTQGAEDDPFALPVARVAASPNAGSRAPMPTAWRVEGIAASPSEPEVALLLGRGESETALRLWRIGDAATTPVDVTWPAGFVARADPAGGAASPSLAWHPLERRVFVAGSVAGKGVIVTIAADSGSWSASILAEVGEAVRALSVGPRPYLTAWEPVTREYRLFFGAAANGGASTIRSLTEHGSKPYQVIGATLPADAAHYEEERPSAVTAPWAEPEAFHPAGHRLMWRDAEGCHHVASYDRQSWTKSWTLSRAIPCGGVLRFPPSGDGLLRWQRDMPGVTLHLDHGGSSSALASGVTFASAPVVMADGRGLVGPVAAADGTLSIVYEPVTLPLGDVANAWMFTSTADARERFSRDGGVFRPLDDPQLYSLYDTERYECGGLDASAPARPYLVTTDVFWEVFAAAYEGLFIVEEKSRAIPAFWSLVELGQKATAASKDPVATKWKQVFAALAAVKRGDRANPEAARILDARGRAKSPILGADADFAEFQPRGHYTATAARRRYFAAFRYLTTVPLDAADIRFLSGLPENVRAVAAAWAAPYRELKAPSRAASAWGEQASLPSYVRRAPGVTSIFPLGWGRDNEALWRTVFHESWPAEEQIAGEKGPRALPSGLDVAAALGSGFARTLLDESGVIAAYPRLGPTLDTLLGDLAVRGGAALAAPSASDSDAPEDLYDEWLAALAVQWSGGVPPPGDATAKEPERLWQTKRLQTGLASWATLRHATVLVNERSVAECGEGGFEPIVMDPPRGYVEPDPATFEAIARLFDRAAALVKRDPALAKMRSPVAEDLGDVPAEGARDADVVIGLAKRLEASAAEARLFAEMARKEVLGGELTPAEYQAIFDVGRVAEHHVLVYRSLARDDLALSNPDPMPRVADVADGRPAGGGLLLVGVGYPLEWDQVVPFAGRRQIVKGPIYGYYEIERGKPMDDATWRAAVPKLARPAWVAPFVGAPPCACAPDPPL